MSAPSSTSAPPRWRIGLLLFVAAACFATSGTLARLAAPAPALLIAGVRCAVGGSLMWCLAPRKITAEWRQMSLGTLAAVGGVGLILAGHFGAFTYGLFTTSLPAAVTLVSVEPIAVVLATWLAFGDRPSRLELAGVVVATLGAVVVALAAGKGAHRLLGDGLVLLAVVLDGVYIACARGLQQRACARAYIALVFLVASASLLLTSAAAETWQMLPRRSWLAMGALGVIATLGGHSLVQWAARIAPPSLVALVSPGETVGSLLLGAWLLSLWPAPQEWLGAAIVLLGVLITIFGQAKVARSEKEAEANVAEDASKLA